MISIIQTELTSLFRRDPSGDAEIASLAAPLGHSSKDPEKIRHSLGLVCANCSVFLLCALVMIKRERAETETVVIAVFKYYVRSQGDRIPENQVSRSLPAANIACNIGFGMTTAM